MWKNEIVLFGWTEWHSVGEYFTQLTSAHAERMAHSHCGIRSQHEIVLQINFKRLETFIWCAGYIAANWIHIWNVVRSAGDAKVKSQYFIVGMEIKLTDSIFGFPILLFFLRRQFDLPWILDSALGINKKANIKLCTLSKGFTQIFWVQKTNTCTLANEDN